MSRARTIFVAAAVAVGTLTAPALAAGATPEARPDWQALRRAGETPAASGFEVVRDRANGRLVMYGGHDGSDVQDGTFVRTDGTWSELETVGSPGPRRDYAMAYDDARDEVVLFGGDSCGECTDDETWILSGDTWEQRTPAVSPPATRWGVMTYDPARQEVVLFTGASGGNGETWTWDGASWTAHQSEANPNHDLYQSEMAWDRSRHAVVLQGGFNFVEGEVFYLGETWAWNGRKWSQLEDGPPVAWHAMASFGRHVAVFAGKVQETWVLRNRGWVELDLDPHPGFGQYVEFVATGRDRVLLVRGSDGVGTKHWRLSGAASLAAQPRT